MRIECTKERGVDVVRPHGLLAAAEAETVQSKVEHLLGAGGRDLVIDTSGILFVDSRGLEALLNLAERQIRQGRTLKLAGNRPTFQDVLELTELSGMFTCYPDVPSALEGTE